MKFKTTKKAMRENYNQIISISYCDAEYLLKYNEPIAYSTRAEGWACDYHIVDNVLISTGYNPIKSRNTNTSYKMIREYDEKARAIIMDYTKNYEEQKIIIDELLNDFIKEATEKKEV